MFDYVILLLLGYFIYDSGKTTLDLIKSGEKWQTIHYINLVILILMALFFVLYLVRIIKKFKNKDAREAEKEKLSAEREQKEREAKQKRVAQYLADYDNTSDYTNLAVDEVSKVEEDENGDAVACKAPQAEPAADSEPETPEQPEAADAETDKTV